jgi:hypothetical protein
MARGGPAGLAQRTKWFALHHKNIRLFANWFVRREIMRWAHRCSSKLQRNVLRRRFLKMPNVRRFELALAAALLAILSAILAMLALLMPVLHLFWMPFAETETAGCSDGARSGFGQARAVK